MTQIFSVTIHDLNRVQALVKTLDFSKDINYFDRILQSGLDTRALLIGQNDAGRDVGICVVNFAPLYPMFRRLNIPEIQDVNVHPDARSQGVGTALIAAAEDLARARGHTDIGIGVGLTAGYGAAQRLYVRSGYIPDGSGIAVAGDPTPIRPGDVRTMNDDVCLYMVKSL